jgi:hypothetical protein
MIRPRARAKGVLTEPVGDGAIVHDQEWARQHTLNQTAAVVWRHCDGQHTVEELAALVNRELGISGDDSVVLLALAQLDEARLLAEPTVVPILLALMLRRALVQRAAAVIGAGLLPRVTSVELGGAEGNAAGTPVPPIPDDDGTPTPQPSVASMDVGVLLPAYLETRFYPPTETRAFWQLKVLVVPDEPFIDRHNPHPSPEELGSVELLWQSAPHGLADLDSDLGKSAWRAFVDRHGGARAAWLARTFPPLPADAEGGTRVDHSTESAAEAHPHASTLWGVPEQLEIWLAHGGNPPELKGTTAVLTDQLHFFPDPDDPDDEPWWTSWERATEVGLGVVIDLEQIDPTDIQALYVIGLSDHEPSTLFRNHRDSGHLAIVELGAPTNSLDGDPAIPLEFDADAWLRVARSEDSPVDGSSDSALVSQALTGDFTELGSLLGDEFEGRDPEFSFATPGWALMAGLWPVLWGHALKDIWGLGEAAQHGGVWAPKLVSPTGPFPAIRIGSQPYGLLPATALAAWRPESAESDEDALQELLQPLLVKAVALWADAAQGAGNVAGADTEKLLKLLGQAPWSNDYAYRLFVPLALLPVLYASHAMEGGDFSGLDLWWDDTAKQLIEDFDATPERKYVALGWPQDLLLSGEEGPEPLPLVAPLDKVEETMTFGAWLDADVHGMAINRRDVLEQDIWYWIEVGPPPSLLLRLLLHARWVTEANLHRRTEGDSSPLLEPLVSNSLIGDETATSLAVTGWITLSPSEQESVLANDDYRTAATLYQNVRAAIETLFDIPVKVLDREMRATLDAASHRIDPWITAYAFRRLISDPINHTFRLGLYGWVDAPRPAESGAPDGPGPTKGGLLHAPTDQQILTSVILRDKAIHDPQADRWAMNLQSDAIRTWETEPRLRRCASVSRCARSTAGGACAMASRSWTCSRLSLTPSRWVASTIVSRRHLRCSSARSMRTGISWSPRRSIMSWRAEGRSPGSPWTRPRGWPGHRTWRLSPPHVPDEPSPPTCC